MGHPYSEAGWDGGHRGRRGTTTANYAVLVTLFLLSTGSTAASGPTGEAARAALHRCIRPAARGLDEAGGACGEAHRGWAHEGGSGVRQAVRSRWAGPHPARKAAQGGSREWAAQMNRNLVS
ncbi:hypothetical protein GLA29479_3178 [Lysobacter antibioticus]|nr:hypothetical protein GLA29479_3178 [Lysobacter antibioticus]